MKSKTGCWFYIRFWVTYWLAWPYFKYLAAIGSSKASEFIEAFTFIMDMKDQVKLKLSLRKLSQVYHYIDPQNSKSLNANEEEAGFEQPSNRMSASNHSKIEVKDPKKQQ